MAEVQLEYIRHPFNGPSPDALCSECLNTRGHKIHDPVSEPQKTKPETISEEAQRIVYGDREKAYDDPNQNFRRLAYMFQGALDKKLVPGATVTPNDVALMMICLKISRESFRPNRENRVDGVGYWECLDRIVTEQEEHAAD